MKKSKLLLTALAGTLLVGGVCVGAATKDSGGLDQVVTEMLGNGGRSISSFKRNGAPKVDQQAVSETFVKTADLANGTKRLCFITAIDMAKDATEASYTRICDGNTKVTSISTVYSSVTIGANTFWYSPSEGLVTEQQNNTYYLAIYLVDLEEGSLEKEVKCFLTVNENSVTSESVEISHNEAALIDSFEKTGGTKFNTGATFDGGLHTDYYVAVPVDKPVGSIVSVTMKVGAVISGDTTDASFRVAKSLYATTPYKNPNGTTVLSSSDLLGANDWTNVTFETAVISEEYINFQGGNDGASCKVSDGSTNYILLYMHKATSKDSFYFKEMNCEAYDSFLPGTLMNGNHYYQSYLGLPVTGVSEGDMVLVSMDVKVDSSMTLDTNSRLYKLDKSSIKWGGGTYADGLAYSEIVTNSDLNSKKGTWMHVEFEALVYSYTTLGWGNVNPQNVSSYGTCVMLGMTNYVGGTSPAVIDNVTIEIPLKMKEGTVVNASNKYCQSYVGLSVTGMNEGDDVFVSMDVKISNDVTLDIIWSHLYALDKSSIAWGGGTYSDGLHQKELVPNSESNPELVNNQGSWMHIEYMSKVYSYTTLQNGGAAPAMDVSEYGLCSMLALFNFKTNGVVPGWVKNVEIQKISNMQTGVSKGGGYYQSYIGLPVENIAEGADVSVEMDFMIPANTSTDDYTEVYALDKSTIQWGGGSWADGLKQNKLIDKNNIQKDTWIHLTFDSKAYTYTEMHWGNTTTMDVSSYGRCVMFGMVNFKNAVSPAQIKNVVITAK